MRKNVAIAIMILFLWVNISQAVVWFVPLAPPAWALGASAFAHATVVGAGIYYYMKDGQNGSANSPAKVDSGGNIKRPSGAVWIDLNLPVPAVVDKPITADIPYSKFLELSQKKDLAGNLLYPNSNAALNTKGIPGFPEPQKVLYKVGDKISVNGQAVTITGVTLKVSWDSAGTYPAIASSTSSSVTIREGPQTVYISGAGSYADAYWNHRYSFTVDNSVQPVDIPRPLSESVPLIKDAVSGDVKTPYQAEIDKMLNDPDYVPVFSDATTGLPFSPPDPSSVATDKQITDYNNRGLASNPVTTSTTSGTTNNPDGTSTTTTTTITNGGPAGSSTTTTNTTTSGPDGTGEQISEESETVDNNDGGVAPGVGSDSSFDGSISDSDKPDKKSIPDLLGSMFSNSPLAGMISSFTVSTSASSGIVEIGEVYGTHMQFDFTPWESIIRGLGGVLLIVTHGLFYLIVFRRG